MAQPGRHRAAVDRRPGPAHPARGARQHREGLLAPARRRRRARRGRPRRQGRHPDRRPQRRPAAPARRGARHRRPPRAALPRRAHHRLRPAGPPRLLGADPARSPTSGTTILLTTHYLDEAEHLADRVGRHRRRSAARPRHPRNLGGRARRRPRSPGRRTASARSRDDATPTPRSRRLAARMPGGEVPALTVTRPSLEDTYLVADRAAPRRRRPRRPTTRRRCPHERPRHRPGTARSSS